MKFVKTMTVYINLERVSSIKDFPVNNPPVIKLWIVEGDPPYHAIGEDRQKILDIMAEQTE